jgi:hypothetical protein
MKVGLMAEDGAKGNGGRAAQTPHGEEAAVQAAVSNHGDFSKNTLALILRDGASAPPQDEDVNAAPAP